MKIKNYRIIIQIYFYNFICKIINKNPNIDKQLKIN
jgi:hypothetical protein